MPSRPSSFAATAVLIAIGIVAWLPSFSRGAELKVGAAEVVINPGEGTPLAGYYSVRVGEGVQDDLYAKALYFEQGGEKAAIVVCDLISMPRNVSDASRRAIEAATGIPGANVLIAATHSHTAPVLAREASRDDFDGSGTEPGKRYTQALPGMIASAVEKAVVAAKPVVLKGTMGRVENLAFNRRFWMEDGTLAWNPRKLDPRIVAPAGPHDPEIGILAFDDVSKPAQPVATFVNYAMHPDTVGGLKVSGDYPAVLAKTLSAVRPGVVMFANGCCGNLNHRNVWWGDPQKGPHEAARLGNILAGAVCEALPRVEQVETAPLRVQREMVSLPLPEITEEERKVARDMVRRVSEVKFMDQVQTFKVLDVISREGRPYEVEVQVITVGKDVAFVSLPGEIFVELGLEIKKRSPFRFTQLIELANGAIGYIPNRSAYPEGNYEVVSARVGPGSGEMLVDAAVRLLKAAKQ